MKKVFKPYLFVAILVTMACGMIIFFAINAKHQMVSEKQFNETAENIITKPEMNNVTVYIKEYPNNSWFSKIATIQKGELIAKVEDFVDYYTKNPEFVKKVVNGHSNRSEIDDAITLSKNKKVIYYLRMAKKTKSQSPQTALDYLEKARKLTGKETKTKAAIEATMIAIHYSDGNLEKAEEIYQKISPNHRNDFEMFGMLLTDLAQKKSIDQVYPSIENFLYSISNNQQSIGYRKEAWFFLAFDLKLLGDQSADKRFYVIADRMLNVINKKTRSTWTDPDLLQIRVKCRLGQYNIAEKMLNLLLAKKKDLPKDIINETIDDIKRHKKI